MWKAQTSISLNKNSATSVYVQTPIQQGRPPLAAGGDLCSPDRQGPGIECWVRRNGVQVYALCWEVCSKGSRWKIHQLNSFYRKNNHENYPWLCGVVLFLFPYVCSCSLN